MYIQILLWNINSCNLRHKFGDQDINDVLKDQVKVHDTLSLIQNAGIIKKADQAISQPDLRSGLVKNNDYYRKNEDYLDLGNYLRHAICHGFPIMGLRSTTSYDFNPNINKEYLSDKMNIDSKYRKRKDYHGKFLCIFGEKYLRNR